MSTASDSSRSPPPDERGNRFNGVAMRSRRQNVDYGVRNQFLEKLNTRELHG
jgi:hypothetical protein